MDPKSLKSVLDQAGKYFASKGFRFTEQREVIVATAFRTQEHFRAEELCSMVHKRDDSVSRATVYRTIALLVESGMLREISLVGGERLYDPNFLSRPHHNHLVCVDCRTIVEFEDANIEMMQNCITHRLGFSPTEKALRIEGSCDRLRLEGQCKNLQRTKRRKSRVKSVAI